MAMLVEIILVGVDVSKAELVVSLKGENPFILANNLKAIRQWLRQAAGSMEIAMEATNCFHLALATEAHRRGHKVYLINGFRLNRYRESIGGRAKTDGCDARLLARYLQRERADLREWEPPTGEYRRLQILLHRRARLVQVKVSIQQSFSDIKELKTCLQRIVKQLNGADVLIQTQIRHLLKRTGWQAAVERCQAIEGVGPLTAAPWSWLFTGAISKIVTPLLPSWDWMCG